MSTELALVGEVVDEPTLEELTATANREHLAGQEAAVSALQHAISAGEALIAIQQRVAGRWHAWLAEHFTGDESVARCYIRIATYREYLSDDLSVHQARISLRGLPAVGLTDFAWNNTSEEVQQEARRLHAQGLSHRKIAALMGVSKSAVERWLRPEIRARDRQKDRARRARQKLAAQVLQEKEREQRIKRAVRKAGAATQEAWAMAERMQDVLAQAQRETEDKQARAALARAGEHYRKMRDEIVRALGVT